VLTGATALVTSDLDSVKGRRARLTGVVKNEDGDELVKATSTWFAVRSVL
jgi:predicted thioesterase